MKAPLAVLAAFVFAATAAPAQADPYVALGDSVAAGSGTYVGKLAGIYRERLGADVLLNRAQAGATSTGLRTGGQLDTARADIDAPSDARAVTIDIGGNDYLSGQCTTNWDDPATCPYRANLAAILTRLQEGLDGDPGAEAFAVMAYYNPGVGTPREPTYDRALLGENGVIGLTDSGSDVGLNDVIYQEAAKLGVAVADPYPAFKSSGPALMSSDGIHPNDAGHAAIARAFCEVTTPGYCDPPPGPGPGPGPAPDVEPPQTMLTRDAPRHLDRHRFSFRFRSSEAGQFECRLDRAAYSPCSSPERVRGLDPGPHTFRVRAVDPAGNRDPTPARDRFEVQGCAAC